MAGINLSTADKILKVQYLPPIRELLNNSTVLLSRLEKDSSTQRVGGKSFTIPLHISRNEAANVGRPEDGTLPTAGAQGYTEAIVPNKYTYSTLRITGPVMAAARDNAQAFVDALTSEMKGLVTDTRRAYNRQLQGNGVDKLATFVSGANSTSVVVDDGLGNIFSHLPAGDAVTVDLLDVSSSYAALNSGITITRGASNGTTGFAATLSSAASASAADGDVFVVAGTQSGLTGYAPMGIEGIIDNADPALLAGGLHGITVAAQPKWAAQSVGSYSSLQDISFPLIQSALSELAQNSDRSEADVKLFLMNYGVRDKYVELCTQERGWYNTMTIDGGFEAVEYNGKPFVPDNQCKRNTIFGIVPDSMKIYETSNGWDWMSEDGAVLARDVNNKDAYTATLFHYGDLGCSERNANIVIKGVRE
jgi:hypothetical protein